MLLKVVGGRLDLSENKIVCRLHDGTTEVVCIISRQLLRDLGDYHQLSGSDEALFSQLLPQIEQLASAKFYSLGIDDHDQLTIATADLLRFGRACLNTPA